MTDKAQSAAEILPCPFCGGAARIESNRDWHRLYADHDEDCALYDANDLLMFPAQPGYLVDIALVWNRRAALKAQQAPTEAAKGEDSARPSAYTCIGKGRAYEVIGTSLGAGTLKSSGRVRVYRDMASGELLYRTLRDFEARMKSVTKEEGDGST